MNHKFLPFCSACLMWSLLLVCCLTLTALSQTAPTQPIQSPTTNDEKAEQIVRRAIEAHGGQNYLAVRSLIGRGFFTTYAQGVSGVPLQFVDYFVFPDRERTEFRGAGNRVIQTNVGAEGWLYDGANKSLKDMKPEQVEDFRLALRTSLDNLLRGWWRKEGAKLTYLGRREAGVGRRNEAVRLTYPDGFTVDFEFDARSGLAAKTFYKRADQEGAEVTEEDRYARHLPVSGVIVPFVTDHYRAGVQSSRISYDSIEFNPSIPDSLFTRPANAKAVK